MFSVTWACETKKVICFCQILNFKGCEHFINSLIFNIQYGTLAHSCLLGSPPDPDPLKYETLAQQACTGHVLHAQTNTTLFNRKVASMSSGLKQANTRAIGMEFPVNTVVSLCRCPFEAESIGMCLCVDAGFFHCNFLYGKQFFVYAALEDFVPHKAMLDLFRSYMQRFVVNQSQIFLFSSHFMFTADELEIQVQLM